MKKNKVPDGSKQRTEKKESQQATKPHSLVTLIRHPFFAPSLYSMVGLSVFIVLIFLIAFHVLFLKVETALISTQTETIAAPTSGYITEFYVHLGDQVKKGTPLLRIENIELERDLNLARVNVSESKLTTEYYQKLITNEHQRLELYKKIGHSRVLSRKTLLNRAQHETLIAKHTLDRYTALYKKHYVSQALWEAMNASYLSAQEQLKNAQTKHRIEQHSLNALDQGVYFSDTKTEGIERDLYAQFEASQNRTALNKERVTVYEQLISKLTILAPFDGKITHIVKSAGNTADTIRPILFIENTQRNKLINAYLTQAEVMKIRTASRVKIYIPSSGTTYHGTITEINHTNGLLDVMKPPYQWGEHPMDSSTMVTIEVQPKDKKEFDKTTFSGMPAIVYFAKHVTL